MSPFVSKEQREYLKINKPKIYRRWKKKYGTTIVRGSKKRRGTIRRKV